MLSHSTPSTYGRYETSPVSFSSDARDALIIAHLPKVKYIADRLAAKLPPSVERDDLYGAGVVGLVDAVDRFDGTRGIAFTTFAEMRVRGAILDNLRSLDWASRKTRRLAREVRAAYQTLEQLRGSNVTEAEVADHMNISVAELRETLQDVRSLKMSDLDERDEQTGLSLAEVVSDNSASTLQTLELAEVRGQLAAAIGNLPEREKQVIALYYVEELTMKEIGSVLSVTESRVSQLRTQAIAHLRAAIKKS